MIIFDKNYVNINKNDDVIYEDKKHKVLDIDDKLILSNGAEIEITDLMVINYIEVVRDYLKEDGGLF